MQGTPGTSIEDAVAPIWRRVVSRAIDLVSLAAFLAAALFLAHRVSPKSDVTSNLVILGAVFLYEVIIPTVSRGGSIGRLALRMRLVREDSRASPSLFHCLVRTLSRAGLYAIMVVFVADEFDLLSVAVVALLEAAPLVLSRRRQTFGDYVARTLVVTRSGTESNAAS